jgi:sulfane dehydrogenase subunit SoxC
MALDRQGLYQITGIAWSGAGSIRHVEVSADGGQTWADALIESHQSDRALTRFRIPWQWQGGNAVLQSRATDDRGNVQPTRSALLAERGVINRYHYHGIQSWSVVDSGEVSNVYV